LTPLGSIRRRQFAFHQSDRVALLGRISLAGPLAGARVIGVSEIVT
jgi:hypothetical protein